jgi:cytochrome c
MAVSRYAIAAVLALAAAGAGAAPAGRVHQGEQVYARCQGCHALGYDRAGPHHCGLFGRRAGSVPGFEYSPAMRRADIVWSAKTLDRFLANPQKAVPGTAMGYSGLRDPGERAALIAYLQQATQCQPRR